MSQPGQDAAANYVADSIDLLKKAGARITRARLAVLQALVASQSAVTPKDLLARIRQQRAELPVDLATVYRILETLLELGLVHRIGSDGAFMACWHLACHDQLHMIAACAYCDRTEEIDLPPQLAQLLTKQVKNKLHFQLSEHFFQIKGVCLDCAANPPTLND